MLLTTHSMEEAEALCDRLGIFINGRLATLGTSQDLKSRYGSGYRMVITTPLQSEEKARAFVKELLPNAVLLNTLAGTQVSMNFVRLFRSSNSVLKLVS